jgi:hypothetical protein
VEGSAHNSFAHSFLAKGRLLYTHDPTVADLCGRLQSIGARDTEVQLLRAATHALAPIYKARKWFITRRDLEYTALWILYAATPLAQMEVFGRRLLADREVIPQAAALNPSFFGCIYTSLLNAPKTPAAVEAALDAIDAYLEEHYEAHLKPLLDYLKKQDRVVPLSEISDHFAFSQVHPGHLEGACEWLERKGLLEKVSAPFKLTKRSLERVEEPAYFLDASA